MKDMKKRHKMKLAFVIAFTLLLSSSLSACATFDNFKVEFFEKESEPEATVRIGVFQPLSGKDKDKGKLEIEGIELAHDMFPTALGKQIELVYVDNKSDINVAESAAKELVKKRVALVLGSYGSANSLVAVKYFEDAKIPAIAITNTNPLVTSNNPYYFRVCLLESFQGVALAKYATEKLGTTSAAIMRPLNDDYATAVAQRFSDKYIQMTENPASIVVTCDYDTGDKDFKAELQRIKDSGAQVVFLPAKIDDAAVIMKQAKELGVHAVFLGTDHWDSQDLITAMGKDAAEGVTFSTIFDPNTDTTVMSDNFKKAYKAKYGKDAVPESAVALAFDAYMIAVDTLNKAGTALDGEKLKDTLFVTKSFPGSSGTITFDINGDPIKSVVVKQIHSGQAESVYTMEPALVNMGE
ncbi:ABC transporter substrate-binding protein [Clostridium aminobutyricum]|uniref:ABC transporter substrate-binding protein n=1 Tax=Clostridium aminobutyricum TaxID=33953 RepID=A0A939DAU6_CLOAM|nr:ABC transporter substrate-binding protein [Clostridium aminobutyricum]MBN7774290.1 ABC transporter substrate-binding protein [Clostridium aminobutyricum]